MKLPLLTALCFLALSCSSWSQARQDLLSSAPIAATDSLPVPQADTLRLLFVGDLMQHQAQIDAARTPRGTYEYDSCFAHVSAEVQRADLAIANLEVTLGGPPYRGYPAFSAPDSYLDAIRRTGFHVLLTANNHCLDRGRQGLERTNRLIDAAGLYRTGTYAHAAERADRSPLLIEKQGLRIALLNYTYGTNGIPVTPPNMVNYIDTTLMAEDIARCHSLQPDAIIACMHWGTEYKHHPEPAQRRLAAWLLSHGVTHVIGGHPHVVQPIEVHTDSLTGSRHVVAYSLGNYISNMSARGTDGGLMLHLTLVKQQGTTHLHHCAYSLVWTERPRLSGRRQYRLLPIDFPQAQLAPAARNALNIFAEDTRRLFHQENRGIEEYSFLEKSIPKIQEKTEGYR